MRKHLMAANWKMNKTTSEAVAFINELLPLLEGVKDTEIVICPPFTLLSEMKRTLKGHDDIELGAQNFFWAEKGAYTGEISAAMLKDVGCSHVIVGHSERRHIFGEKDDDIHKKIDAALAAGLIPILCAGETLEEREAGKAFNVVEKQLENALQGLTFKNRGLVIAYEPVWAIGTGINAKAADAQEMLSFIRQWIRKKYGDQSADTIPILYGGSVKPANIDEFMAEEDIDGALIGGASLHAGDFARIVRSGNDGK